MRTAIIAVSRRGIEVAALLTELYPEAHIYAPPRFLDNFADPSLLKMSQPSSVHSLEENAGDNPHPPEGGGSVWGCKNLTLLPLRGSFREALGHLFFSYRLLIFISAAAVAVRAIAPYLEGKDKDPAVVTIDEQARFAISLLSGHLGGANAETENIGRLLNAQPVITTATDSSGITAFDDLTRRLGWQIENLGELKKISAALLEEREIYVYSERPFHYSLQDRIKVVDCPEPLKKSAAGYVIISSRLNPLPEPVQPDLPCLMIRPLSIAAGVGCRRGIPVEAIINMIEQGFKDAGRSLSSLACLATGEFKSDEEGLLQAAAYFRVPLKIYTRPEIAGALEESILSDFVKEQVGVGAVAEPCARLASGSGEIIMPTRREKGGTLALAEVRQLPFPWQKE
ncbi:MAG: cobalamin biosynthesis protein [Bacillota bacterium]|nr:cobalamin biosynthesis protein [Bacillota bacterium]